MEIKKAVISIGGKDYELKFTIGFWRKIKEECDIDNKNLSDKLANNFVEVASKIILASIVGQERPTVEAIESSLDMSVKDVFEQATFNGMTKVEREIIEAVEKERSKKIADFAAEQISGLQK